MFVAPFLALALIAPPDRAFNNNFYRAAEFCFHSQQGLDDSAVLIGAGFVAGDYEGTWNWPAASPRISVRRNDFDCTFEIGDRSLTREEFAQLSRDWLRANDFRIIPDSVGAPSFLRARSQTIEVGGDRTFGDLYYLHFTPISADMAGR